MPITTVSRPDGSTVKIEHPEGASDEDILGFAYQQDQLGMQQDPLLEEEEEEEDYTRKS
jgi:hypothetical protein